MNKFIVRIVVFLLVPCLIADPMTASALHNPLSPHGWERAGVRGEVINYQDQALNLCSQWVGLRLLRANWRAKRMLKKDISEQQLPSILSQSTSLSFPFMRYLLEGLVTSRTQPFVADMAADLLLHHGNPS